MTVGEVKKLQRGLNFFTHKYATGIAPIRVDGHMGPHTRKRIRTVKFLLGYLGPINSTPDLKFRQRMWHPKAVKYSNRKRVRRGIKRRIEQRRKARANHRAARKTTGVGSFDGVPVANVAIPILQWCRNHGWLGRLVSGFRTAAYSTYLCIRMCGRPSCPGRCAGASTNHTGTTSDRFALDVSDYVRFGQVVAHCPIPPHIFNALPIDRVHYSPTGR